MNIVLLNRYIDSISIYEIYVELAEIEKHVETGQSNGNELAKNPRSLMVIKFEDIDLQIFMM